MIKKQMPFERVATCARVGCSPVLVEDLRSTRPMTGSGVSRMSSTRIRLIVVPGPVGRFAIAGFGLIRRRRRG